jgi:O-antigen/teichoic acid export membrane protein
VAVTNILLLLSSFILIPVLTKNLSANDYGVWIQFTVTLNLLLNIIPLGLPFGMVRFLSAESNREKIVEDFYSLTAIVALVSVIISLLVLVFAVPLAGALFSGDTDIVYLLPLTIITICLNSVFLNYFRTFRMMKLWSFFSVTQSFLLLALVGYFIYTGQGLYGAVLSYSITNLVLMLLMLLIIVRQIGVKIPLFTNIREYMSFSLPTVPGNLSYWALDSSDRYIIGLLMGNVFVAYYSPSYTMGNIIMMFLAPFSFLLPAVLPKYFERGDMDEVRRYLKYTLKYFMLLAIPSVFGLSILSRPILTILSTSQIADNGFFVTPFVALSAVIYGLNSNINQIIILNKKTKVNGSVWIITGISNVILNIIMIPYLGILGAAAATLISSALAVILTLYYNYRYLNFKFDFNPVFIGKSVLASLVMSVFLFVYQPTGLIELILAVIIGFVIYIAALFLVRGIKGSEIRLLKSIIKNP